MTPTEGAHVGPAPGGRVAGVPVIRTALAWRRTALAFGVVALLAARLALTSGGSVAAAVGCVAAAGVGCVAVTVVVRRRLAALHRGDTSPSGRVLLLCAFATVGYALVGIVLMIL